MDYSSVLRRAWDITWRYKGLWILGILAGCSGNGGSGAGGRGGSGFNYNFGGGNGQTPGGPDQFFNNVPEQTWIILGLGILCLIVLLVVLFVVLGAIGRGGLMAGFNQADEGEHVGLSQAFRLSLTYFWRVLAIQLLVGLAWLVALGMIAAVAIGGTILTLGIGLICIIPLLCLLVPLAVAVGIFAELAQVAVVVENTGIMDGLGRAWAVIKTHVGPILVMALVLIVGGFVVGLIVGLPALVLIAPLLTGLVLGTQTSITSGVIISGLCLVMYLPVAIVLNGILQTFVVGSWTLTYRRLTGRGGADSLAAKPA